jgi:hypothetical protein
VTSSSEDDKDVSVVCTEVTLFCYGRRLFNLMDPKSFAESGSRINTSRSGSELSLLSVSDMVNVFYTYSKFVTFMYGVLFCQAKLG